MISRVRRSLLGLAVLVLGSCLAGSGLTGSEHWPTAEWRSSSPRSQGMSAGRLRRMAAQARRELPGTDSILVVRHGRLVFERYFQGADSRALRNLFSVTKSVVSILVGIAIDQQYIEGLDQPVLDFFPEFAGPQLDPQAATVSIRHLLTMTDGLSKEWARHEFDAGTFTEPPKAEPGTQWFYNSLSPQLLSSIITRATGMKAVDFARKHLLDRLGIAGVEWWQNNRLDSQDSMGAFGLRLAPRDLAKIGYLFLRNGRWEHEQLVSPQWVSESTRAQVDISHAVPGFGYGFYWWAHSVGGARAFSAQGFGGPWLVVVPDRDLVAVVTTSEIDDGNSRKYLALIEDYVLPSVRR